MTRELIPASSLSLLSQPVDGPSESSIFSSSETAGVTDSSGPVATETVLENPKADSQVSSAANSKSDWDKDPNAWKFIIYPVYAWVPFFSSRVTLPEIPSPPGGGGPVVPTSTTSGSLNGAAFAGAEIYKGKWSGTFTFLYAGLSSTRTTPRTTLTADFLYGQALVERDVYKGLSFGAGFRRMALDLTATLDTYPSVSRKPGFWDPLLSATYRERSAKSGVYQATSTVAGSESAALSTLVQPRLQTGDLPSTSDSPWVAHISTLRTPTRFSERR